MTLIAQFKPWKPQHTEPSPHGWKHIVVHFSSDKKSG